ncbi:hypothetical protein BW21_5531 [Burkholderia humptydooensis]|nr:hypothetical protein BW21_5531 [Burkholderia sp. 2002721687]
MRGPHKQRCAAGIGGAVDGFVDEVDVGDRCEPSIVISILSVQ